MASDALSYGIARHQRFYAGHRPIKWTPKASEALRYEFAGVAQAVADYILKLPAGDYSVAPIQAEATAAQEARARRKGTED